MRLSKTALLAASLITSGLVYAVDNPLGNYVGQSAVVNAGDTTYTTTNASGSINRLTGDGTFIKNGTGILQYLGYQEFPLYTNSDGAYGAEVFPAGPTSLPTSAYPQQPVNFPGFTGTVVVNKGEFQVAGYLNRWFQSLVVNYTTGMSGVDNVILNDSAVINFINTPLNVARGVSAGIPVQSAVPFYRDLTLTKRYNMVSNLQVGGIGGGMQTILNTGADNSYRIFIYADNGNGVANESLTTTYRNVDAAGVASTQTSTSGIGIIAGRGDLIKIGADSFQVLGRSENGIGRIILANGTLDLVDSSGNAISTATSVNLVGNDLPVMISAGARAFYDENTGPNNDVWKSGYLPVQGESTLKLSANQSIFNLQADFAFTATPTHVTDRQATIVDAMVAARDNQFADEPYLPGTGAGTFINLQGHTLTVLQNRDGIYRGSVVSKDTAGNTLAGAVFDLTIAQNHTFALISDTAMTGIRIVKRGAGRFLANANGLGDQDVQFDTLDIYQDNAGTLLANLIGGGAVNLTASAFVNNSLTGTVEANRLQINVNDTRGTLAVGRIQSAFTGTLNILDGQTLQLGTGTDSSLDNSLAAANTVTLQGGDAATGGRVSTLFVASGTQTLKNLVTNANSVVNVGKATLVLNTGSIAGSVIGVGSIVAKNGTLALNAASSTYTGATVVSGSTLNISGGLTHTSGLILASGSTINAASADQSVGGLFGQAGSTLNMGSRTLRIGLSGDRLAVMQTQSRGTETLSTNYLSTRFQGAVSGGNTLIVNQTPASVAGQVDVSMAGDAPTYVPSGYAFPVGRDPFSYADSGLAAATSRYLYNVVYAGPSLQAAALAAESDASANPGDTAKAQVAAQARAAADAAYAAAAGLAYAGAIAGSGDLVMTGPDRTILTGVNTYTGATRVQGGELQVNWNSVASTSGIAVSSGATFSINADTGTGGDFTRTITGAGALNKLGGGLVGITSSLSGFTGAIGVQEGTLRLDNPGTYGGNMSIFAGATLALNTATDIVSNASVSNAGTLVKQGAGMLTLGSYTEAGASVVSVEAGTLALSLIPQTVTIATGATLQSTVNGTQTLGHTIGGTGTFRLVGGSAPATLVTQNDNLFSTVALELRGTTLDIGSTTQTVSGFSGDATSSIRMNTGSFVLNTPAGIATTFNGILSGNGHLVKQSDGAVSLTSTVNSGWLGDIVIQAGRLEATPQSLGDASNPVDVQAAGTLALLNDDTANVITFLNPVTGAGKIAKTGAGTVAVGSIFVTGGVSVEAGRLIAGDGGSDGVFRSVAIASGATFQVTMSGDRIHDSASVDHVTGAGNLAVSGGHTLTLAGVQSYTGNTELLNGATLVFGAGVTSLNGLAGDATSSVVMPGDLTIVQTANGTFSGNFTGGPGALVVAGTGTLAVTGDLASQAGLTTVTVNGGRLQVDSINTKDVAVVSGGTLAISDTTGTHASHHEYTGVVTGNGNVDIVGGGYVFINDTATLRHLQNTGTTTVSSGTLGGDFTTSGNLVVAGGTLAPGNSPGTVNVNGNFTLAANGIYAVEINATASDKVVATGSATLAGALKVTQDATPGSAQAAGGRQFTIISAAGGISGAFSNANTNGVVTLDAGDQAATGLSRVQVVRSGTNLDIRAIESIRDLSGIGGLHDGLGGLVSLFDSQLLPGGGSSPLQAAFDAHIGAPNFGAVVANLSPLGYGAEYAMAQDGENRRAAQIHDRMEQRRYDRGSPLTADDAPWEAFIAGQSSYVNSNSGTDTATFDYKTYGGLGGLDRKLNDGTVVGAAIGYDNGTATIHNGGGKIEMDRFAATAFFSGQLTSRWYIDAGVTGGVGLYESKRDTVLGRLKGDNMGYSGGAFAETGTLVVLTKDLHLTPYVGIAYTHHEFDGFTEKNNAAALKVDSWSQDSLRAKIGTGLNYFVPFEDWKLRFGLDINYAQELLDTDSDLDARFASGGSKFRTTANALPDGAIGVTPSLGIQITEYVSADIGYTYEVGTDSRSYQSVNFAVRTRF